MLVRIRRSPSGPSVEEWELEQGSDLPGDADSTIVVAEGSLRVQAPQSRNCTVRLSASGAGDNEGIEIQKRTADAYTLTVLDDTTSALLYVFPAGETRASDFIFDAGTSSFAPGGNVAIRKA